MICKVCGAKIIDGADKCELCGSQVGVSQTQNDPTPAAENSNDYNNDFQGQAHDNYDIFNAVTQNNDGSSSHGSKINISINSKIFAVIFVALLVIAIPIILLLKGGSNKPVVNNYNSNGNATVAKNAYYISDETGVLSSDDFEYLSEKLEQYSDEVNNDLIVLIVESTGNKSAQDYADDYYDTNNYGYGSNKSGMLFLIFVSSREWYISTAGDCISIFSDNEFDKLENALISKLQNNKYFEAIDSFCDTSKKIIQNSASSKKTTISTYDAVKSDATWYEAEKYAINAGGHLAYIDNYDEFNKICSFADEKNIKVFWVSANRDYNDDWNNAKWGDGKNIEFIKWYPGEPSYTSEDGDEEEYLMVFKVDGTWYFNDAENDVAKYYKGKLGYVVEFETEE